MSIPLLTRVAFPLPLYRTFTYRIPDSLAAKCAPGCRVLVPFGRRSRVGVVVDREGIEPVPGEVKTISEVLDPEPILGADLREFARWISDYYFAPLGLVYQAALPTRLRIRVARRMEITEAGRNRLDDPFHRPPARVWRVLDLLARFGPLSEARVRQRVAGLPIKHLRELAAQGLLRITETEHPERAEGKGRRRRRSREGEIGAKEGFRAEAPAEEPPAPTSAQAAVIATVTASLDRGAFEVFLLRGVTGSGKTEVYLRAAEAARARGRGTLYLVPEIGLTPLLARRLRDRFGDTIAMLHSGLSEAERRAEWERIRIGSASLILGTRSAVFAPHPRFGLVVVDEEQDDSYYQSESPRYCARDAVLVRARSLGATVVLGTATPSLEAVDAVRRGKFRLLTLPERVERRPLPEVRIVDMREEFRLSGTQSLLSRDLTEAIRETQSAGEQTMLLLNRRGFATFLLCRSCGERISCPGCSIALTYHRAEERLRCHYCGRHRPFPAGCPACRSPHLHPGGAGTQRLEEAIREIDPGLRVARMDRDTVRGRRHAEILERFQRREIDLLLGTQMLAKGHDFPGVTLVGVLSADALLGLPDFRAAERTYQLLTQVSGRAGRGDRKGRVIIQAFATDHPALVAAARHDPELFYRRELRLRALAEYPPSVALTQIRVEDRNPERVERAARALALRLRSASKGVLRILGPSPSPHRRLKGRYRFQILVKGKSRRKVADGVRAALGTLPDSPPSPTRVIIETDPRDLL